MKKKMKTKKLTAAKLKDFIKDEKMGAKEYFEYGLPNLAKDELHHKKILELKLKKKKWAHPDSMFYKCIHNYYQNFI